MSSPGVHLLLGNSLRKLLLDMTENPLAQINMGTEQEVKAGCAPMFAFVKILDNYGCYVSKNLVLPDTDECLHGQDTYYILKINNQWMMFRGKKDCNGILVVRVPVKRTFGCFWKNGLHKWQFNACSRLPPYANLPSDVCDVTWGNKIIYETAVQEKCSEHTMQLKEVIRQSVIRFCAHTSSCA